MVLKRSDAEQEASAAKAAMGMVAAALLDEMAGSAHRRAGSGIMFFDNLNRTNMLERTRGGPPRPANPCWSGETRVLTRDGPVPFRDLAVGPSKVKVMTREDDGTLSYRTMENPGVTRQGAEVVCLVVESRQTGECAALRCTPDHRVYAVSPAGVERRAVADLTPGTSLASLYLDGSVWEQTVGVSAPVSEVPERAMRGTGHPAPGILPLSLAARKGRQRRKRAAAEGFVAADGSMPEAPAAKKPGIVSRLLGRTRRGYSGNHTVLAVIRTGRADVYNGMVDTTHNYFVECGEGHYILSGNCGERAPYPGGSCRYIPTNVSGCAGDGRLGGDRPADDIHARARMPDGAAGTARHMHLDAEGAGGGTRRMGPCLTGAAHVPMHTGMPRNPAEACGLFGRPPFGGRAGPYCMRERRSGMPRGRLPSGIERRGGRDAHTPAHSPGRRGPAVCGNGPRGTPVPEGGAADKYTEPSGAAGCP